MNGTVRAVAGWAALGLFAGAAAGDFDLFVRNGTTVTATLADGADVHVYRAPCPAGAKVAAKAKSAKGGPAVRLRALDGYGAEIGARTGPKPALAVTPAASSTETAFEVASADAAAGGAYALVISWKSPKAFKGLIDVAPDGQGEFPFSVDAGAEVTVTVKAKKSGATPSLAAIAAPDGSVRALAAGATAKVTLDVSGTHVLRFGGGPAGGAVSIVVQVKPPRTTKTSVAVGAGDLSEETHSVAFASIDGLGGILEASGTPIAGSAVSVPAGALAGPTTLSIGFAPAVSITRAGTPGGPAVFFGPEGLTFAAGKPATVTIPFDPAAFPSGTAGLRVFTRGADGQVTEILDPVVDAASGTVTFATSHFSAFQVLLDFALAEKQRLTDTQPVVFGQFGWNVAVDGDVAAAGSTNAQSPVEAVQVFHRTSGVWSPEARFGVANPVAGQFFGTTLALSGSRLLVGAQFRTGTVNGSRGTAFVFLRTDPGNWALEAELPVPFDAQTQRNGFSVSIDGDTAVVATPVADAGASGKAHVFQRNAVSGQWEFVQTLVRSVPATGGQFGFAAVVRGDRLFVGANLERPGAVYAFRRTGVTWTQAAVLRAIDPAPNEYFGSSIDVDGTTVVIGSDDPAGTAGRAPVRVFEDQGASFPLVARLDPTGAVASGESPLNGFGRAVAVRGDVLLVGAPFHSTVLTPGAAPVSLSGNVYAYRRTGGTWRLSARLRGSSTDAFAIGPSDNFGLSLAFDGSTILVNAVNDDTAASFAGAVFVFDVSGN